MIILICGLSGVGKTSISSKMKEMLDKTSIKCELIDADIYRSVFFKDLGFSKSDRMENIRRLCYIANRFSSHGILSIVSAINPYEDIRSEMKRKYENVKVIFLDCDLEILVSRDTKGLYKRAYLADGHKDKIYNLPGVNDIFERPVNADLYMNTGNKSVEDCVMEALNFIFNS